VILISAMSLPRDTAFLGQAPWISSKDFSVGRLMAAMVQLK
jgi:hypothetical protein